jgi:hypothetical protein
VAHQASPPEPCCTLQLIIVQMISRFTTESAVLTQHPSLHALTLPRTTIKACHIAHCSFVSIFNALTHQAKRKTSRLQRNATA